MSSRPRFFMRRPLAAMMTAVAALAIGLVGTVPAVGAGSTPLKYPFKVKTVPNVEPGVTSAKIDCPADHPLVTGGGVEITGNQTGLDLEVGSTLSDGNLGAWTAVANNSSADSASMRVTAICAIRAITFRRAHKNVPPNTQGHLKVSCPAGSELTGGGVRIGGGTHKQEVATTAPFDGSDADHRPDDGWQGRANNGLSRRVTMTVDAVCARRGTFSYVHSARQSVGNNQQVTSSIDCPTGTKVTGGGVGITGTSLGIEVADTFPFDGSDADHTPDDGWQGAANNDSSGQLQKMQVFAICRN